MRPLAQRLLAAIFWSAPAPLAGQPIAITGVTVIDVAAGRSSGDRTVVVAGTRIAAVGPRAGRGAVAVPPGARVIDGRGAYLIPGLWDMHAHPLPSPTRPHALDVFLPLFVANGVTGVRQMGDPLPGLAAARARSARGDAIAPRLVASGLIVDGPLPQAPGNSIAVRAPAEARRVVDSLADAGVDFIKVYSALPRDSYAAVLAAARRRGLPVAGHVPAAVPVDSASAMGQRSIEHLLDVIVACSAEGDALRQDLAAGFDSAAGRPASVAGVRGAVRARALARVDWPRCRALFARLARRGTWVTPTLVVGTNAADSGRLGDPRLRYFEPATVAAWRATRFGGRGPITLADAAPYVRALARAGVGLLAGTDLPSFATLPGFDLHRELALLVEAGLTPAAALRAATLEPARYLGATDSLGTVAAGKLADLVLLDGDPLADVRNTTRIRAVVAGGRYLDRAALDSVLAGVERAAGAAPAR